MSDFETVPVGTMKELEKMKEEHDALKAHFHRLAKKVIEHCSGPLPGTAQMELLREVSDVLRDLPATSLARRDLLKQAEVLERCAKGVAACKPGATPRGISIAIKTEAEELRRQAEGGE